MRAFSPGLPALLVPITIVPDPAVSPRGLTGCPVTFQVNNKATFISVCFAAPICGCVARAGFCTRRGSVVGASCCARANCRGKNTEHLKTRSVCGGLQNGELRGLLMPSVLKSITQYVIARLWNKRD